MYRLIPILALWMVGCAPSVELSRSGKKVELLTQSDLGKGNMSCRQQAEFDVVTRAIEKPASRGTVGQIKARNATGKKGFSHVLVWPGSPFTCDREGTETEVGTYECERVPASAYDCILGR